MDAIGWDTLPMLLDRVTLQNKLGLKRRDADRIFDRCTEYRVEGSRKPYVSREEVRHHLAATPSAEVARRQVVTR